MVPASVTMSRPKALVARMRRPRGVEYQVSTVIPAISTFMYCWMGSATHVLRMSTLWKAWEENLGRK
jgi:hypothetical protein